MIAMATLKRLLPAGLEPYAIRAWILMRPLLRAVFHGRRRYCPLCGSRTRRFMPHGPPAHRAQDARCPVCRSVGRHRFSWLYMRSRTDLLDARPKRLLHVAPEISMMPVFERMASLDYLSIDLESRHAMARMDLTALDLPDASVDAIYCSHVLEHIPDDRQAMREMHRVLKPGGWVLIQVPLSDRPTFEDPSITDPLERERHFLQSDHVRLYGFDIRERLAAAGFEVAVVFARDVVAAADCERMSIHPGEVLFDARKRR